jgi:hypothetical protein
MTTSVTRLEIELAVLKLMRRARAKTDADIAGIEGLVTSIGNDQQDSTAAAREMSRYLLASVRIAARLAELVELGGYEPRSPDSDLWADMDHLIRLDNQ